MHIVINSRLGSHTKQADTFTGRCQKYQLVNFTIVCQKSLKSNIAAGSFNSIFIIYIYYLYLFYLFLHSAVCVHKNIWLLHTRIQICSQNVCIIEHEHTYIKVLRKSDHILRHSNVSNLSV